MAGSSHPALAKEIAEKAKIPLGALSIFRFPDGETRVQLEEEVAGKSVFIVQSMAPAPNERLIETFLIADALHRGGARESILVCPFLAYSRQSLQEREGVSVAARLFADFFLRSGVTALITMDLHAEYVPSFYSFSVEHLHARQAFIELYRRGNPLDDLAVVGPDLGSAKLAAALATELQASLALVEKRRIDPRTVALLSLIGEVKGKNVLLADDMCSTAGTVTLAAKACHEKGAKEIVAVVTHGIFAERALDVIMQSPISKMYVSNTIAQPKSVLSCPKICVFSVASVFAAALQHHMSHSA